MILSDHRFLVLGLGKTGISVARYLQKQDISFFVWDDTSAQREKAKQEGYSVQDFLDPAFDFKDGDLIVQSPGIPHTLPKPHPILEKARQSKDQGVSIEWISDLEFFIRLNPAARIIAITGTNGKSTTTALIGHLLTFAGISNVVGGNIGYPVFDASLLCPGPSQETLQFRDARIKSEHDNIKKSAYDHTKVSSSGLTRGSIQKNSCVRHENDQMLSTGFYVWEVSSYHLELTPSLSPYIGILLNITPDHLDRHGNLEGYTKAKELLFQDKTKRACYAVIGCDTAPTRRIFSNLQAENIYSFFPISFSHEEKDKAYLTGMYREETAFFYQGQEVFKADDFPALKGLHNLQNAAAAYAVGLILGLSPETIFQALQTFPGLTHRQEKVGEVDGITFINDSKGTNVEAVLKALSSFDNIYWILGGKPKEDDLLEAKEYFPRIQHAFSIGEATEKFYETLAPHIKISKEYTLEKAVRAAYGKAKEAQKKDPTLKPVILLSPACASFDQFKDFEHRGEVFKELARQYFHKH